MSIVKKTYFEMEEVSNMVGFLNYHWKFSMGKVSFYVVLLITKIGLRIFVLLPKLGKYKQ